MVRGAGFFCSGRRIAIVFCVLGFCTFGRALAQSGEEVTEQGGEFTIEIDSSQSRNAGKSLGFALALSALVPGGGEAYLHEKKDAKTFLLLEAGFWAALYFALSSQKAYIESARGYASAYAGVDASGKGADFLEAMVSYRAYRRLENRQDSYELAQVLSGKRPEEFDIAPHSGNYWDFGAEGVGDNDKHWSQYRSTMRHYRASKVAVSFAIGALALNRVASLINTLHTYRTTSSSRVTLRATPEWAPGLAGARLTLKF